mmetsp:Transcript_55029/g.113643  ORF Transcript_55029/g.113643 Transcript_55029/m.113643 type:complete len:300 (+) Transcript_55029:311-1210(+)
MQCEAFVANPPDATFAVSIRRSAWSAVAVFAVPLLVEVAEIKVAGRIGKLGNRRHVWIPPVKKLSSLSHTLLVGGGTVDSIPPAELDTFIGFRIILPVAMFPRVIVLDAHQLIQGDLTGILVVPCARAVTIRLHVRAVASWLTSLARVILVVVEIVRTGTRQGVPDGVRVVHRVHGEGILAQLVAADVIPVGGILILVLVRLEIWKILSVECTITTELWLVTFCCSVLVRDVCATANKGACGLPLVIGQANSEVHPEPKKWCSCTHLHLVAQNSRDSEFAGCLNDDLMVEVPQDTRQAA